MEVLHQLLEPVAFHGVGDSSIVDEGIGRPEHLGIGELVDSHQDVDGQECPHLFFSCVLPSKVCWYVQLCHLPIEVTIRMPHNGLKQLRREQQPKVIHGSGCVHIKSIWQAFSRLLVELIKLK
ncbi:hypothetical protein DPMN_136891 [Dreissena polymorpha]|uniref:Uncharacterized protein n=1 Tax=Dreissena polymorpha TaxID=45954 RepID=A0A9D4JFY8_DREPO|nr:hypothetical protein DPMN_136891 [Dreissena polymorpha]